MKYNTILQRLLSYKIGLILGFLFGAIIAPLIAILGMLGENFGFLKPLFAGPMLFIGSFIPDIQTGSNSYDVPIYKWILTLGFNGICYAILGVIILSVMRRIREKR